MRAIDHDLSGILTNILISQNILGCNIDNFQLVRISKQKCFSIVDGYVCERCIDRQLRCQGVGNGIQDADLPG
ncbi:MAG: hypothetical protein Q8896_08265, partial [Bacteroidota bacterium]|nr:hypothetical protein [Bacteroidota bacterium]